MKDVWKKYRETVFYVICGGCTTVINFTVFWLLIQTRVCSTGVSTSLAWLVSVLFAYYGNKIFVFQSTQQGFWSLLTFFATRIGTGIMEIVMMVFFVDLLKFPEMGSKLTVSILVTILNYLTGKFWVFGSKDKCVKEC